MLNFMNIRHRASYQHAMNIPTPGAFLSGTFLYGNLETVWTVQRLSGQSRECLDYMGTVWTIKGLSG